MSLICVEQLAYNILYHYAFPWIYTSYPHWISYLNKSEICLNKIHMYIPLWENRGKKNSFEA
jgi:hypothetical protein